MHSYICVGEWVCVCTHVYVFMCVHVFMCKRMCMHVCIWIHVCAFICMCMCGRMCVCVHWHVPPHIKGSIFCKRIRQEYAIASTKIRKMINGKMYLYISIVICTRKISMKIQLETVKENIKIKCKLFHVCIYFHKFKSISLNTKN